MRGGEFSLGVLGVLCEKFRRMAISVGDCHVADDAVETAAWRLAVIVWAVISLRHCHEFSAPAQSTNSL